MNLKYEEKYLPNSGHFGANAAGYNLPHFRKE